VSRLGLFYFVEHGHGFADLFLEITAEEVEHFPDEGIAHGVENLIAGLAGGDDLFGS